jgi:hypothetical protein
MPRKKSSTVWTDVFLLPGMAELGQKIQGIEGESARLRAEGSVLAGHWAAAQRLRDALLAGQGTPLVEAASRALAEVLHGLNFKVVPADRTDGLAVRHGSHVVAAVTVRGTLSQGRLADVRRLQGLVDALRPPGGRAIKGILIANAERRKDPRNRAVAPFAPGAAQAAQAHGFCLLTAIQLFNLVCDVRRGTVQDAKALWEDLRATAGVYHKYNDWQQNLRA